MSERVTGSNEIAFAFPPVVELPLHELPEQYELLGKVSQGGMGAVYKAKNRFTDAVFAIKLMLPELAYDEAAMKRFTVEAKAATGLRHPNICQVIDFGVTRPSHMPYLVMEWIEGISLSEKVERGEPIPQEEAVVIFQQIAKALGHAHKNRIVHRDLKPQNIMVSRAVDGTTIVHLVDFGIAKVLNDGEADMAKQSLTKTGMVVGTPLFMSPEQATGDPVDGRSDIYSFGCLMHYTISGKPPFLAKTHVETINLHLFGQPPEFNPASNVSPDLERIILKAMEKDPKDRYQLAEMLGADLRLLRTGGTVEVGKLAVEKKREAHTRKTIITFILSFAAAYGASIIFQLVMNAGGEHAAQPTSKAKPAAIAHVGAKAKQPASKAH